MRALLVTAAVLGLFAVATPARAEHPADAAAAEALFERGRGAAQRGDLQQACDAFEESQRLDPAAGTLMNWAMCETRRGKLASAWQHFSEADALLKPGDDRLGFVRAQLHKLAPRLPRLTIRLSAAALPDSRVLRGGTELGAASLGVPIPVDPGELELLLVCAGHAARHSRITLHESDQVEVTLEPGAKLQPASDRAAATPPPEPRPAAHGTVQRDLGLSLLAAGSLGVGVALASGVVVAQRKDTAQQHCPANRCDASGFHAAESGERWLLVNTVAWSLGAAALVGGATLLFTAPDSRRSAALQALPGGAAFVFAERY